MPDRGLDIDVIGSPGMLICWPGPDATAGVFGDQPGDEHLIMLLDPLALALTTPPQPTDRPAMARFLRELAHSATLMADRVDPTGQFQPSWATASANKQDESSAADTVKPAAGKQGRS
ncbi:MAG TPA: hypothetical protein VFX16_20305 [Pseudonocardiaceae bacterium]|nr:hypothetical protein [Pseudonocardiaceae bacterium]